MSELDLQEQEQVDALKAWWKDNGKWVVGVLVVAMLGFSGMQFWKS
jgi:predicted negative regulator of RcsB-dependent stress response